MTFKDIFIFDHPRDSVAGGWKEALLLFSVFFLPGIISSTGKIDAEIFNDPGYHLRFILIAIPQIILMLHLLHLQHPEGLSTFGLRKFGRRDLPAAGAAFLGALAILALVSGILAVLPEEVRHMVRNEVAWKLEKPFMIPAVLLTSLITGYREEIFFRSYLLTRFDRMGVPFPSALVASSLLFASGHLYQGSAGLLVSFILGSYFAVVFRRTGTIHVPAVAHGLYNAAALAVTLF